MAARDRTHTVTERRSPPWLNAVLLGSVLWIAVALVRGVTFALTHAVHGM